MVQVGFEPTPPKRLELESSALDHSATEPRYAMHWTEMKKYFFWKKISKSFWKKKYNFFIFVYRLAYAVIVAEWLRRQTWNLVGFARAGSNPVDDVRR